MIDKTMAIEQALAAVKDGHTVMVGGFGVPGTPFSLIDRLLAQGTRNLTLVKNEANEAGMGISKLLEAGRVRTMITSHLGLNPTAVAMMNRGDIEVELYPQGILAEKIRAGGAGLLGIVTDIGIDTILRENRQLVRVAGREAILEPALRADIALIHAATADRGGNLQFAKSARNFGPLMAMAADRVIVETEAIVPIGALIPTPCICPAPLSTISSSWKNSPRNTEC